MTLAAWIDAYRKAWETNEPAGIRALFSEDAAYFTEPYAPPWRGRDEIVRQWLARLDEPGETTFEWEPLTETPELGIAQGRTTYRTLQKTFSNLWVIRFAPDGRCREFTEWWMQHDG
jgi:ketosteroid isomerase-like protein